MVHGGVQRLGKGPAGAADTEGLEQGWRSKDPEEASSLPALCCRSLHHGGNELDITLIRCNINQKM